MPSKTCRKKSRFGALSKTLRNLHPLGQGAGHKRPTFCLLYQADSTKSPHRYRRRKIMFIYCIGQRGLGAQPGEHEFATLYNEKTGIRL